MLVFLILLVGWRCQLADPNEDGADFRGPGENWIAIPIPIQLPLRKQKISPVKKRSNLKKRQE